MLENAIARYVVTNEVPKPAGNRHTSIVPFEPFDTKDSKIVVAAGNDAIWERFCKVSGLENIMHDDRFKTNPDRNKNYDELRPIIAETMVTKTTEEWNKLLDDVGVPNGPINYVDKVLENEQVIARNMIVELEHPVAGKLKVPGIAIKLSETPGKILKPAPLLGQHNQELLKEFFDYTDEEIAKLINEGVL